MNISLTVVPCAHWSDCGVNGGGCCANPAAREKYGPRPSLGVCMRACTAYEGPDRINLGAKPMEPIRIVRGERPGPKRPRGKIASYLEAEASLMAHGPVTDAIRDARLAQCRSCEHRISAEDHLGWCGACGCGTRRRAKLEVKATMPAATCPKGKWPVESETKGKGALPAAVNILRRLIGPKAAKGNNDGERDHLQRGADRSEGQHRDPAAAEPSEGRHVWRRLGRRDAGDRRDGRGDRRIHFRDGE